MENFEFLNLLGHIHFQLKKMVSEFGIAVPNKRFKLDLSFYTVDRKSYPQSPIGVSWQIDIDEKNRDGDDYFTFELFNESNLWMLDGYVSKHLDLELISSFIEIEDPKVKSICARIDDLLILFKEACLNYLQNLDKTT